MSGGDKESYLKVQGKDHFDLVCKNKNIPSFMIINGLMAHNYMDEAKYATYINSYSESIKQGYIVSDKKKVIRVREKGNDFFITIKGNKIEIQKKQNKFVEQKKISQPSKIKTCGSTFKNPNNKKAWELIKQSGCENLSIGGARLSEKHCNFFMNNGDASSKDIEMLIEKVREKVLHKTGIKLDLEIKIIGKK